MAKFKSKSITKKIQPAVASVAGGLAANILSAKLLSKVSANPKVQYGIAAAAGLFLTTQKNEMISSVGIGMITVAGMKLAGSLIPGLEGVSGIESDIINGLYDDVITEDDIEGIINGVADSDEYVGDGDDY